jgi:hypothetical protein
MHSYDELLEAIKYIHYVSVSAEEEYNQDKFETALNDFRSIECKGRLKADDRSFKDVLEDKFEDAKS